jgi:hypothetical protein
MIENKQITETSNDDDQFLAEKAFAVRVLVRNMENNAFIHMVAIGRELRDVRAELSRRSGAHKGIWLQWLDRELGWTDQTARNVINLFNVFGCSDPKRVWDWKLPLRTLYKLAAPSTPEAARVEVLARAEAGESPTYLEVKAIVAAHAPKAQQPEFPNPPVLGPEPQPEPKRVLGQPSEAVGEPAASAAPAPIPVAPPPPRPAPEVFKPITQPRQPAQQDAIVTLRRLVEDLQSQLVEAHKQIHSLGNTLKERDAQIETTLKERDALRGQLVERDANIETLQRQLTGARTEIQSLRSQAHFETAANSP